MTVKGTFSSHLRIVAGLSVLALATAGLTVVATNALFTSAATVTTGTFTTGNINLGASPATALLSFATMAPGNLVYAPITVNNTGSIPLRYSMTSASAGALAGALTIEIKTVPAPATNCDTAGVGFAAGTAVAVVGPVLFNTPVLFGNVSPGFQGGERTLVATTGSEVLCAKVMLPLGTTDQSLTAASATFTFTAEQTTNN